MVGLIVGLQVALIVSVVVGGFAGGIVAATIIIMGTGPLLGLATVRTLAWLARARVRDASAARHTAVGRGGRCVWPHLHRMRFSDGTRR